MTQTDLLVIGAGPAGCSAAIYGVRAGLKTIIAGGAMPGGQLLQTNDIENYAGFENPVGGFELMDQMHKQCKRLGVQIITDEIDSESLLKELLDQYETQIFIHGIILKYFNMNSISVIPRHTILAMLSEIINYLYDIE